MRQRILYTFLFALAVQYVSAQQRNLDTIQIISIGSYNVTIHDASKIKDAPLNDDSTHIIPKLNYGITSKKVNTTYTPEPLNPPHMVGEALTRLYKFYAKAGFGNYTTPYGEIFFNNLRSKEMSYGIHLKHQSSYATLKDKGFSGYSDNEVNLYGKRFIRKHTLSADLGYVRNVVHCYGYDTSNVIPDHDITRNLFQDISLGLALQSHLKDSSGIQHTIRTRYTNYSDNHLGAENNIFAGAELYTYYLGQRINLDASVDFYNNHFEYDTVNDAIIHLSPSVKWGGKKVNATLGVDVAADASVKTRFHFYPKLEVNYDIIDQIIIPYAGVRGGIVHNSYRSLSHENPFVKPNLDLRNTDRRYEFFGGLRGSISSNMTYNVYTTYGKVNDLYFFVNDFSEVLQNRFTVVYDSVKALGFHAELGFQKKEKISFMFKGDYNRYYMMHQAQAWHRPQMQLTFTLNYNLKDKIIAHADVFVMGKQLATKAPKNVSEQNFVELKGATDINLGFEYRYTKKISAFANFNNLGSFRYERWQNYPTQRFNFLAGLTYAL